MALVENFVEDNIALQLQKLIFKSLFFFSQICPPTSQYPKVFTGDGTGQEADCKLPEALKHIEEKCHDQQVCSLVTAPEVFGPRDPCPGFRKYVEVAYKCKPTNFRSRTACQGDTINITCSSDQVLPLSFSNTT